MSRTVVLLLGPTTKGIVDNNLKPTHDNVTFKVYDTLENLQKVVSLKKMEISRIIFSTKIVTNAEKEFKEFSSFVNSSLKSTQIIMLAQSTGTPGSDVQNIFVKYFGSPNHLLAEFTTATVQGLSELVTYDLDSLRKRYGIKLGTISEKVNKKQVNSDISTPKKKEKAPKEKKPGFFASLFGKKKKEEQEPVQEVAVLPEIDENFASNLNTDLSLSDYEGFDTGFASEDDLLPQPSPVYNDEISYIESEELTSEGTDNEDDDDFLSQQMRELEEDTPSKVIPIDNSKVVYVNTQTQVEHKTYVEPKPVYKEVITPVQSTPVSVSDNESILILGNMPVNQVPSRIIVDLSSTYSQVVSDYDLVSKATDFPTEMLGFEIDGKLIYSEVYGARDESFIEGVLRECLRETGTAVYVAVDRLDSLKDLIQDFSQAIIYNDNSPKIYLDLDDSSKVSSDTLQKIKENLKIQHIGNGNKSLIQARLL